MSSYAQRQVAGMRKENGEGYGMRTSAGGDGSLNGLGLRSSGGSTGGTNRTSSGVDDRTTSTPRRSSNNDDQQRQGTSSPRRSEATQHHSLGIQLPSTSGDAIGSYKRPRQAPRLSDDLKQRAADEHEEYDFDKRIDPPRPPTHRSIVDADALETRTTILNAVNKNAASPAPSALFALTEKTAPVKKALGFALLGQSHHVTIARQQPLSPLISPAQSDRYRILQHEHPRPTSSLQKSGPADGVVEATHDNVEDDEDEGVAGTNGTSRRLSGVHAASFQQTVTPERQPHTTELSPLSQNESKFHEPRKYYQLKPQQQPQQQQQQQQRVVPNHFVDNMVGVCNLGNSCYASAVLTLLLRTPKFVAKLSKFVDRLGNSAVRKFYEPLSPAAHPENHGDGTSRTTSSTGDELPVRHVSHSLVSRQVCPVSKLLKKLFEEMRENSPIGASQKMANPTGLARLFYPAFFDHEQHDAHEFYVSLVAQLEQEAVIARAYRSADRELEKAAEKKRQLRKRKKKRREGTPDLSSSSGDQLPDEDEEDEDDSGACSPNSPEYFEHRESLVAAKMNNAAYVENKLLGDAWINKLLRGKVRTNVVCRREGCGCTQTRVEPFVNISLAITKRDSQGDTDRISVEDLVRNSLRDEVLEDYKCDGCGSVRDQHQSGIIEVAPSLLVIQLKRYNIVPPAFQGGEWKIEKDGTEVKLNEELQVAVRKSRSQRGHQREEVEVKSYRLHSIVLHRGHTPLQGHYTAEFLHTPTTQAKSTSNAVGRPVHDEPQVEAVNASPQWYRANDASIMRLGLSIPRHQGCAFSYLLLYEKVKMRKDGEDSSDSGAE